MATGIEGSDKKSKGLGKPPVNTPPTIWTNIRDNKLAAPDAYSEEGNQKFISELGGGGVFESVGSLANLVKGVSGVAVDVANKVSSALGFISNLGNAIKNVKGDNIFETAMNIAGLSSATLSKFNIDQNSPIFQAVKFANEVAVEVNGVYQLVKNASLDDLPQLAQLTHELTGNDTLISISNAFQQAQVTAGVITSLITNDIPNAFAPFKEILKDSPYKEHVIKTVYPAAVEKSDLQSINAMVDLVGRRRFNSITGNSAVNGNFTSSLASKWEKKNEPLRQTEHKKYQQIKETLKKVHGNDWLYTERNGKKTINVKDYLYSTPRFGELLRKGTVSSNQVRVAPPDHADINDSILDEISGNSVTSKDDEKFLFSLGHYGYLTPTMAIMRDFPKIHLEKNLIVL